MGGEIRPLVRPSSSASSLPPRSSIPMSWPGRN